MPYPCSSPLPLRSSPEASTHDQAAYAVDVAATRALAALALGHEP